MTGPFAFDGYDVLAPLDAAGRRWRAVAVSDGRAVMLRRWIGAGQRLAEARRQAPLWGSLPGEGVVAVVDVRADGADLVVVSEGGGEPLDLRLARQPTLSAGQVVTLVAGVAEALAVAHRRGLVHGRLTSSSVLLGDDGRPRLTDCVFGGDAEPAADVAALVAIAAGCLAADAPAALVSALESATDASGLVAEVLSAARAEPLVASPTTLPIAVATTPQVREPRVRAALVVGAVVAAIAVLLGVSWSRQDPAAGAPSRSTSVAPTMSHPTSRTRSLDLVVVALERQRIHALAHVDIAALGRVEARGTALWRRDAQVVSRLVAAHARLRGLHVDVKAITEQSSTRRLAVVRVIDALSSYDVVDAGGVVLDHHPARSARAVELVLVQHDGRWRIRTVSQRAP